MVQAALNPTAILRPPAGFGRPARPLRRPAEANRALSSALTSAVSTSSANAAPGALLDELLSNQDNPQAPGLTGRFYRIDGPFPGFAAQNDLHLPSADPLVSLWLGNPRPRRHHYDLPTTSPGVVSGRRRFSNSPARIGSGNLYVGPLDNTPPASRSGLVDAAAPDFDRFPLPRGLEHAQVAEMEPGDAIFIPASGGMASRVWAASTPWSNFWWKQSLHGLAGQRRS